MRKAYKSHYDWLEDHLQKFFEQAGAKWENNGIIVAHGDKCSSYQTGWEAVGIPFEHGVAIYLLSYISPFNTEVRDTPNGWVPPNRWVVDNYSRFKPLLPAP